MGNNQEFSDPRLRLLLLAFEEKCTQTPNQLFSLAADLVRSVSELYTDKGQVGGEDRPLTQLPMSSTRLILERGDGECLIVGDVPEFNKLLSVAEFLIRLAKADKETGMYHHRGISGIVEWHPKQLEFNINSRRS